MTSPKNSGHLIHKQSTLTHRQQGPIMTGNTNSRKSALHEAGEPDLPVTEAGYHMIAPATAPAEILQFRHPHNSNDGLLGSPLDDEDAALMNLIKAGDFDTRQNLVARNLRLVLDNTRRYAHKGVRIFGLLKAGNLGLDHALENFDREGNGCFSAYAAWCIRQSIEHAILNWDGRDPVWPGKPDHGRYRIVACGNADKSPVRLIRNSCLQTSGQIN